MLLFCHHCGNLLVLKEANHCNEFFCVSCPYKQNVVTAVRQRTYPKLKELDDVLASEDAWKNAQQTEERCPQCAHMRAFYVQMQTRSADEPMTTKYRCVSCAHVWNE